MRKIKNVEDALILFESNVDIIHENTATIRVLVNIRGKLSIPVSVKSFT